MMAGTNTQNSFLQEFLHHKGIHLLKVCASLESVNYQNCRDISHVFAILDAEGYNFYSSLSAEEFKQLIEI